MTTPNFKEESAVVEAALNIVLKDNAVSSPEDTAIAAEALDTILGEWTNDAYPTGELDYE